MTTGHKSGHKSLVAAALSACAAAAACVAGVAQAADLPLRAAPAPYAAPVPVFTWTGAYFGVNAGAAIDDTGHNHLFNGAGITAANTGIGTTRPTFFGDGSDGFTAGAQIGYNYEFGGFGSGLFGPGGIVVGFEADAAYVDAAKSGTITGTNAAGTLTADNTFRSGLDFLGTARGRVGYAFDRLLVYGTGGFAYGETFQDAALFTPGNAALLRYYGSRSGLQTGYTYGGGVEYALPTGSFLNVFHSSAITVKAEYLRYDLGHASFVADGQTLPSSYVDRTHTEGNLARVGLNYKF